MTRFSLIAAATFLAVPAFADTVTITPSAVSDIVVSVSSGGGDALTCVFSASDQASVPAGCNYEMVTSGGKSASLRPVDNPEGQDSCTVTCFGN